VTGCRGRESLTGENVGRVEGKVAFITSAARGQGRSHAIRLAEEGADIVIVDIAEQIDEVEYTMPSEADLAETAALVERLDRRVIARKADVRSVEQMQAVADEAIATFGHIDIVIANAGITSGHGPFYDFTEAQWDRLMDVNLKGAWVTCKVTVPSMVRRQQGGAVVITASGAGLRAAPGLVNYNVSKHGVVGLMKTMANELAPEYIRVNAVCPSTVDTPMIQHAKLYQAFRPDLVDPGKEDVVEAFRGMNPIPEPWLAPSDVSDAVLWLVSDEARFITGVALPVDFGLNNKFL
jgi:SDR family mycofactocin-dependent oxidoreductase